MKNKKNSPWQPAAVAAALLLCAACNTQPATNTNSITDTLYVPDTSFVHPDPDNTKPLFDDTDGQMAKFFAQEGYAWSAEFERTAWEGNLDAIRILATMYAYGIGGVNANRTTAFFLYRELANHGDLEGMTTTGYMMLYGIGPLEDTETGLEMLSNAANHDYAMAWYVLGNYYNYNLPHDAKIVATARLYYQRAAQLGMKEADEELRKLE